MRAAAACLLAAVLIAGSASAMSAEQPALLVVGGATSLSLEAEPETGYDRFPIRLLLRNPSDATGTLEAVLRPEKSPSAPLPAGSATGPPARTDLVWTGAVPTVSAQQIVAVELELRVPPRAVGALPGTLFLSIAGNAKSAVALPVSATAEFEQDEATLVVTRALGPLSFLDRDLNWGEMQTVGFRGTAPGRTARLGSSDGGTLVVHLRPSSASQASLDVADIRRVGSYSGSLVLDPEAKTPEKAKVNVRVRDAIYWPLAALLLGTALAYALRSWQDVGRSRSILRASLREAVGPYLARRARWPDHDRRPPPPELEDLLQDEPDQFPNRRACRTASAAVPRLYCRIRNAGSSKELERSAVEVEEIRQLFRRYMETADELDRLARILGRLPASTARRDLETVLTTLAGDVPSDEEMAKEVSRLRRQRGIAAVYLLAHQTYAGLPEEWRKKHTAYAPEARYAPHRPARGRSIEQDRATMDDLVLLRAELAHHLDLPEDGVGGAAVGVPEAIVPEDVRDLFEQIAGPEPQAVIERLRGAVRAGDWTVFVASAVIVAVAYLVAVYRDKPYGTLEDYLLALAAAGVGTLAINWALAPLALSDRVLAEKPKAKS